MTRSVRLAFASLLFFLPAKEVLAKANGIPVPGCDGCHNGGSTPKPTLTAEPPNPPAGGTTVITVHIPAVNGPVAGFYLTSNMAGSFTEIPGQGTRRISNFEEVHAAPKAAVNGEVTFQVRWTAPAMAGGAAFDAFVVSGNGDRSPRGDGAGATHLAIAFGCAGVDAWVDQDGDGYGANNPFGPTKVCQLGPGYAARSGDCDDYNKNVHPGAKEVCNLIDDNCDGQVNEGLENAVVYRDADGDGYGGTFSTDMHVGCIPGYSSTRDDCDDTNPDIHPGAKEVCNLIDDNCDGHVDEGVRPDCGTGWCRRVAPTCDPSTCVPGQPRAEQCNDFDDDCDGVVDNGPNLCPNGQSCVSGVCGNGHAPAAPVGSDAGSSLSSEAGPSDPPLTTPEKPGVEGPGPDHRPNAGCQLGADAPPALGVGALAALLLLGVRRRR